MLVTLFAVGTTGAISAPWISAHAQIEIPDKIVAVYEGTQVKFRFFAHNRDVNDFERAPATALSVRRENDSAAVWQIESGVPFQGVDEIAYGHVPEGFVQRDPPRGTPAPALEPGRTYVLTGIVRGFAVGRFTHISMRRSGGTMENLRSGP
jgi:hypothetical protein